MTQLHSELVATYRHYFGRKCGSFKEADEVTRVTLPANEAAILGIFDADELGVADPFDDIPKALSNQMVFILKRGEKHYLINTEGFSYCRYTAPCTIEPVPLRLVTVSVTVAVQEGTRPEKWIADAVQDNLETYAGEELVTVAVVSVVPVEG